MEKGTLHHPGQHKSNARMWDCLCATISTDPFVYVMLTRVHTPHLRCGNVPTVKSQLSLFADGIFLFGHYEQISIQTNSMAPTIKAYKFGIENRIG